MTPKETSTPPAAPARENGTLLKRYDLKFFPIGSDGYSDIVEMEGGDYVKFEDAEALAQHNERQSAEIASLKIKLEKAMSATHHG